MAHFAIRTWKRLGLDIWRKCTDQITRSEVP